MEFFHIANPVSFGSVLAACEDMTETIIATRPPAPITTAAVEFAPLPDVGALRKACAAALERGAEVLLTIGADCTVSLRDPIPLPVISLRHRTAPESIRDRIMQLEQSTDLPGHLSEEHARARIIDIVDRVAANLHGHIIVEDESFQMVAYSQLANPVDEARQSAILQRQLPPRLQVVFNAQGVLADLLSGRDLVETRPAPEVGLGARLVVAIRHNGRLVGTIWLAREAPAFSERDVSELQAAARQMSVILAGALRERHDEQLRRDDASLDLLNGRNIDAARKALWDAPLETMRGAHVLTVAKVAAQRGSRAVHLADFRALAGAIVGSMRSEAIIVPDGPRLCIIHFGCEEPGSSCSAAASRHVAAQISEGLRRVNLPVAVGIGKHVERPDRVVLSAQAADQVLTGLLRLHRPAISTVQDSWAFLLINAFLNVPHSLVDTIPRPLGELLESGSSRDLEQLLTVRTALNHWGDVGEIAKQLHIHQNTVRYRLQRFSDTYGIELEVPVNRLALWMLLTHEACFDDRDTGDALAALLRSRDAERAPNSVSATGSEEPVDIMQGHPSVEP